MSKSKNWFAHIKQLYFHHIKLQKKLMISYGLLIAIPVVVMYVFSYAQMAEVLERNLLYSASQNYEQAHEYTSYKLYKMLRTSDLISNNNTIHELLTMSYSADSYVKEVDLSLQTKDYLTSFEDAQDIFRIRLYIPGTRIYADEGINFLNLRDVPSQPWYPLVDLRHQQVLFLPSNYLGETDSNLLSILRPIYDPNNYEKVEGYLRVDFKKSLLLDILERSDAVVTATTYVTNGSDELILSSNPFLTAKNPTENLSTDVSPYDWLQGIYDRSQTSTYTLTSLNDIPVYIRKQVIPNTDWYLTSVIPQAEVLRVIQRQRMILIGAILAMLGIAMFLAYYISHNITKRLDILTHHMKHMDDSVLITSPVTSDEDEIGQLAKDYNRMHKKIKNLMDEQYEAGQALKSAELRAIQAQINPHFLYNTLEMINWMAKKQETDKILTITKELSKFYKLSLNKGNDMITIRDEVAHVLAYIAIQNHRFEGNIHVSTSVDPVVAGDYVPKILLQPIIENAITHGIMERDDQEGQLDIRVYKRSEADGLLQNNNDIENRHEWSKENTVIQISDNGVGMSYEQLNHLFDSNRTSKKGSHYGLYNIKERLRLFYDDHATLEIDSHHNKGTTITITLPRWSNIG